MLELFVEYRSNALYTAIVAVTILAFWKGGGPERAVAAAFWLAMIVPHRIFHLTTGWTVVVDTIDIPHAALDLFFLFVVCAIAIQANRMYPLWFAALQLVAVMAHLARAATPDIAPIAYAVMYLGPSYLQTIVLGVGVWRHIRRKGRHGPYPDWRTGRLLPFAAPALR